LCGRTDAFVFDALSNLGAERFAEGDVAFLEHGV
jgi:hypothetical protein